jgi:hypothetical protein
MRVPVDERNFVLAKIAGKRTAFRVALSCGQRNLALDCLLIEFPGQGVIGGKPRQELSSGQINPAVATGDPIQTGFMQHRRHQCRAQFVSRRDLLGHPQHRAIRLS